jgi:glycine cleavage system H protein
MSNVPENLSYTKDHEWVEDLGENRYRVGITDFAQSALGDIVYVQLPKLGLKVEAEKVFAEVESTKSVSEIYSPISGEVTAVNELLAGTPETINQEAYGAGWIVEITATNPATNLLSAAEYKAII